MISQLKDLCGFEYTAKLQRMFNDVRVSADLTRTFTTSLETRLEFNFSTLILQSGAWPLSAQSGETVALPRNMSLAVEKFDAFYNVCSERDRY